jgi:hypothetical protein
MTDASNPVDLLQHRVDKLAGTLKARELRAWICYYMDKYAEYFESYNLPVSITLTRSTKKPSDSAAGEVVRFIDWDTARRGGNNDSGGEAA